jgi:hypothetical protein
MSGIPKEKSATVLEYADLRTALEKKVHPSLTVGRVYEIRRRHELVDQASLNRCSAGLFYEGKVVAFYGLGVALLFEGLPEIEVKLSLGKPHWPEYRIKAETTVFSRGEQLFVNTRGPSAFSFRLRLDVQKTEIEKARVLFDSSREGYHQTLDWLMRKFRDGVTEHLGLGYDVETDLGTFTSVGSKEQTVQEDENTRTYIFFPKSIRTTARKD